MKLLLQKAEPTGEVKKKQVSLDLRPELVLTNEDRKELRKS